MKKIAALLSVCLFSFQLLAQNETNIWYFGFNGGLDFNSGSAVSLSGGLTGTSEGSASISDTSGNLLFYTDGITVWDKNHIMMTNGFGLHGGFSSTQSALIVPLPLSDSLYYIFTTGEQLAYGLQYSVVDMSLQAGLGEVITKNVGLANQSCEKITGVCHANDTDIWVISHAWNSNSFGAYQLTPTGIITTPVISSVGSVMNGNTGNTIGYLKGSPNGDRLAVAVWTDNWFELYDFDKTTGIVSNDLHLPSFNGASSGAYGVEFSPDGSKLYGSVITPGYVYQWDLNAGSDSLILASKTLVGTSSVNFNGALQLASDGKIYMAQYTSPWLATISKPDSLGMACDFSDQGFMMSSGSNGLGLPNIYPCFFEMPSAPSSAFSASDTTLCEKFCINYFDSSQNSIAWQWTFEGADPPSSTDQNPTNICYDNPGVYDVTLITTSSSGNMDTSILADYITVYTNPFAPTITQTGNMLTSTPADSYQWQLNSVDIPGATNQSYEITQSGLYTVIVFDENGCTAQSDIKATLVGMEEIGGGNISVYPNPVHDALTIVINHPISGIASLEITNALGQIVWSRTVENTPVGYNVIADLSLTPSGIYLLTIKLAETSITKKILIAQ